MRSVIGLLVFTIPFTVYMGYVESTHESHHEKIVYPHMKCVTAWQVDPGSISAHLLVVLCRNRAKKFPWGNGECDLFDSECKAEAAKAAQA